MRYRSLESHGKLSRADKSTLCFHLIRYNTKNRYNYEILCFTLFVIVLKIFKWEILQNQKRKKNFDIMKKKTFFFLFVLGSFSRLY